MSRVEAASRASELAEGFEADRPSPLAAAAPKKGGLEAATTPRPSGQQDPCTARQIAYLVSLLCDKHAACAVHVPKLDPGSPLDGSSPRLPRLRPCLRLILARADHKQRAWPAQSDDALTSPLRMTACALLPSSGSAIPNRRARAVPASGALFSRPLDSHEPSFSACIHVVSVLF